MGKKSKKSLSLRYHLTEGTSKSWNVSRLPFDKYSAAARAFSGQSASTSSSMGSTKPIQQSTLKGLLKAAKQARRSSPCIHMTTLSSFNDSLPHLMASVESNQSLFEQSSPSIELCDETGSPLRQTSTQLDTEVQRQRDFAMKKYHRAIQFPRAQRVVTPNEDKVYAAVVQRAFVPAVESEHETWPSFAINSSPLSSRAHSPQRDASPPRSHSQIGYHSILPHISSRPSSCTSCLQMSSHSVHDTEKVHLPPILPRYTPTPAASGERHVLTPRSPFLTPRPDSPLSLGRASPNVKRVSVIMDGDDFVVLRSSIGQHNGPSPYERLQLAFEGAAQEPRTRLSTQMQLGVGCFGAEAIERYMRGTAARLDGPKGGDEKVMFRSSAAASKFLAAQKMAANDEANLSMPSLDSTQLLLDSMPDYLKARASPETISDGPVSVSSEKNSKLTESESNADSKPPIVAPTAPTSSTQPSGTSDASAAPTTATTAAATPSAQGAPAPTPAPAPAAKHVSFQRSHRGPMRQPTGVGVLRRPEPKSLVKAPSAAAAAAAAARRSAALSFADVGGAIAKPAALVTSLHALHENDTPDEEREKEDPKPLTLELLDLDKAVATNSLLPYTDEHHVITVDAGNADQMVALPLCNRLLKRSRLKAVQEERDVTIHELCCCLYRFDAISVVLPKYSYPVVRLEEFSSLPWTMAVRSPLAIPRLFAVFDTAERKMLDEAQFMQVLHVYFKGSQSEKSSLIFRYFCLRHKRRFGLPDLHTLCLPKDGNQMEAIAVLEDLFSLVDRAGDSNGKITYEVFQNAIVEIPLVTQLLARFVPVLPPDYIYIAGYRDKSVVRYATLLPPLNSWDSENSLVAAFSWHQALLAHRFVESSHNSRLHCRSFTRLMGEVFGYKSELLCSRLFYAMTTTSAPPEKATMDRDAAAERTLSYCELLQGLSVMMRAPLRVKTEFVHRVYSQSSPLGPTRDDVTSLCRVFGKPFLELQTQSLRPVYQCIDATADGILTLKDLQAIAVNVPDIIRLLFWQ